MSRILLILALLLATAIAEPGIAADIDQTPASQVIDLSQPGPQMTLAPFDLEGGSPIIEAACCKVCSKGKACGNSCISRDKTCHKPPGCACDAQ